MADAGRVDAPCRTIKTPGTGQMRRGAVRSGKSATALARRKLPIPPRSRRDGRVDGGHRRVQGISLTSACGKVRRHCRPPACHNFQQKNIKMEFLLLRTNGNEPAQIRALRFPRGCCVRFLRSPNSAMNPGRADMATASFPVSLPFVFRFHDIGARMETSVKHSN